MTIELAAPALVGFFIDGYPFVVGSTVVSSYTPAPASLPSGRIINGCMKNPPMRKAEAGFDSAAGDHYVGALNDANNLPLTLDPGDSLLIAVSDEEKNTVKSHLSHVALLTVVDAVPPADAFRPAYRGPAADISFLFVRRAL